MASPSALDDKKNINQNHINKNNNNMNNNINNRINNHILKNIQQALGISCLKNICCFTTLLLKESLFLYILLEQ